MSRRRRSLLVACLAVLAALGCAAACSIPSFGASAILHSWRRSPPPTPALPHEDLSLRGVEIDLCAWRFAARAPRRGLVVYLHGSGDDRRGSIGIAQRFTPLGFDVLAFDSRAHGRSGGEACTYGVLEKRDLARVLDGEPAGPVALIGFSLGGAIALQAAAEDARISTVVAIAPFSDLRTIASERAPFFMSRGQIEEAFRLAAEEGGFRIDDASPLASAPRIVCPVLLVHGADDGPTPPSHSQRIFDALTCPKELLFVPGLGHDDPLPAEVWGRIQTQVEAAASVAK